MPELPLIGCRVGKNWEGRSISVTDPATDLESTARGRRGRLLEPPTLDLASTPFVPSVAAQLLFQLSKPCDFLSKYRG
jgi:hypothetical protein